MKLLKEEEKRQRLNSSHSPIEPLEEEKDGANDNLLFMEDVENYDSLLRKSSYLDSPPSQVNPLINFDIRKQRIAE